MRYLSIVLLVIIFLFGCVKEQDLGKVSEQESNEELNIAYPANLQTLDPHTTTNQSTRDVARHIFEQLLTLDENYEVVPSLAEAYEVSEDGLIYTFYLREGVFFHNGEEMQAEDVVASMEKWIETSSLGQANLKGAKFVAVDPYTVELHVKEASLIIPYVLADQAPSPAIVPKELAESAKEEGLQEFIGTGPYQLEEWKGDQYIHLKKFSDYKSRTEASSGLSGEKKAPIENIYFHIVPDSSTRVAGIKTGDYDIVIDVPLDNVDSLEKTSDVELFFKDGGITTYVFNKKSGPFSDVKLRQAFNIALDAEEAMLAAFSDERFFVLESSLALPQQENWYSTAGSTSYHQKDLEKGKEMIKELGKEGEEITIITTKDYPSQYSLAVVAQQLLEEIGLEATIEVYDWPTLQEVRTDPDNFDLMPMSFAPRATLHQYPFLDSKSGYPGWTDSQKIDELLNKITEQSSFEEAAGYVDQLHVQVWEELPVAKIGNQQELVALREEIKGFDELIGPILWNVSKEK